MAIMSAFQAEDASSIPASRSRTYGIMVITGPCQGSDVGSIPARCLGPCTRMAYGLRLERRVCRFDSCQGHLILPKGSGLQRQGHFSSH